MERKYKSLTLKANGVEQGLFSGWASRYGEIDAYQEITTYGCFDATYRKNGGSIVILSDHDVTKSVGLAKMTLRPEGLWLDAKLSLDLADARDAYVRLRDGLKSGLSIGFSAVRDQIRKDGVREILEVILFEVSVVQIPALDSARIVSVKNFDRDRSDPDLAASFNQLRGTIRRCGLAAQTRNDRDPVTASADRISALLRKIAA